MTMVPGVIGTEWIGGEEPLTVLGEDEERYARTHTHTYCMHILEL